MPNTYESDQTVETLAASGAASNADRKRWGEFRNRIAGSKSYRRELVPLWTVNVDYRRGKPFSSQTDDDRVAVNLDWSYTKTKETALFSQIPQVRINHPPESVQAGSWVPGFERRLNDVLVEAGVEAAMGECLPDCINAAGVGAVIVSYEAITEDREIPDVNLGLLPPELQMEVMTQGTINGQAIPTTVVPITIDRRYVVNRISPSDLLWPTDFMRSDFDMSPWIGHTGRVTWAEAKRRFGLTDEDRHEMLGDETTTVDRLTHDWNRDSLANDDEVGFDEIFYRRCAYESECQSFKEVQHLVFVHGREEPVIDEPWEGQEFLAEGDVLIGALDYPIRVLTLAYITDEAIPPSDSSVGRSQVNELNKGRTQIIQQRERSMPIRWMDINRVDPSIQQAIMRGVWQHIIPVQGDGSRILGEVARASMPGENYLFDTTAKKDLGDMWGIGPNQAGAGTGVETRGESGIIDQHYMARVSRERAKVGAFFVGIARIIGGLMCLYENPSDFGEGFNPAFSTALRYSILADSTVLIDANQRLSRLDSFVNRYGKSGWVQLEPVLKEIAGLVGLDPNVVISPPEPAQPDVPNISIRLTGTEDMMNPLTLALLIQSGQAPSAELIEQAKQLIQQAVTDQPPAPEEVPFSEDLPLPEPLPIGSANPDLTVMPTITKRSDGPVDSEDQ